MATSPQRLKREDASSLLDAFAMEPSLVDTILSYVPSTNASDIKKTIANVCLALPTSYRSVLDRVRPSNQAFWRRLVLTSFNFEVDPSKTFNVEDYDGEGAHFYDRDEEIQAIVEEWEQTHGGAQVDEYLLENLAYWQHLEVYFRPSQYGFLRAIQMGELLVDEWPAHEDAFTLFCDLSTLVDEFKAFENLYTFSDGDQFIYPCLLSELQKPLGPRNFELLEHCGIAPHFWEHESPPVWRWAEFGGQAFWRQLVLATFDFEVDLSDTFNVEDYSESSCEYYSEDREVLRAVKKWERANNYAEVEDYLLESLACWEHLEMYFRPSQYGFLRAIQQGELPMDAWPDHEDAFTLFCDLSTLIDEFNAFEDLRTSSDGDQFIYPCLLSEPQKPLGPRNFELLEHCGIAPHFWEHEGPPVWRWAEFGGQVTCDGYIFPLCEDETLPALKALVATKMRDWRAVMVDIPDGEYAAPMFFLGTTKHSQRCLGYVGQRDYY
ncbi:hypothetical protein Poli38472_013143 [Pythium oligandrum]|uniref:Uncharacterized protein n=1 Tax=Pythium oligandrum TaxID=41045 RepID=A0A8K1C2H6_PYTOL|nr:hypothetical protein Poli38472_013143 [Pythium oligandrum]|eukprot:TMW55252.1 hypothetical protein Poli38472_013143 [Pythium oligandrum]